MRASKANPIVGAAVALVTVDVLYRIKIIDRAVFDILVLIIGTSAGADILGKLGADLTSPLGSLLGSNNTSDLLKPVGQTLTEAETKKESNSGDQSKAELGEISSLLGALIPK